MRGVALLLLPVARAALVSRTFGVGAATVLVAYNDSLPFCLLQPSSTNCIQLCELVLYNATLNYFWFNCLSQTGNVNEVVCEPTQVTRIPVAPRGCDNANPALALENSNCAPDLPTAVENLQLMLQQWDLPWVPGEELRFGPVTMVGVPPGAPYSDAFLLQSQGVVLEGGLGPLCSIPTIVPIQIAMPQLIISTTSCLDYAGHPFAGVYAPNRNMYSEVVQFLFQRVDAYAFQTFGMIRNEPNGVVFNLELTDNLGATWVGTQLFVDFVSVPQNTTFLLYQGLTSCTMSFYIAASNRTLLPPLPLDDVNYQENHLPLPYYYTSAMGGYRLGYLAGDNTWAIPGCCEGCPCFGVPQMTTSDIPAIPLFFPADPNVVVKTCDQVYPPGDTIPTWGGGTYPRQAGAYACYAPFILPNLVNQTGSTQSGSPQSGSIQEKFKQCLMLGGVTFTPAKIACQVDLGWVPCRAGWLYFDTYCYYKANGFTDANMAVPGDSAEAQCQAIGGTAAWSPNQYLFAWMNWFVQYMPDDSIAFRVVLDTGFCWCFNYVSYNNSAGSDSITAVNQECTCDLPAFPTCRYAYYDQPQPYVDVSIAPETRALLQRGQPSGLNNTGLKAYIQCFDGFTGTICREATCPLNTCTNTNNTLCAFQQSCILNNQGHCYNGQPRVCACNAFYGPDAAVDPSLPFYSNVQWPCVCPGSSTHVDSFWTINGELYNDTAMPIQYIPCGGVSRGSCMADPNSQYAYCQCQTIPVLDPASPVSEAVAYDGKSCMCAVPLVPPAAYDANIEAGACNNRGTCCPFGERLWGQLIDGQDTSYLQRCPPNTDGCVCDNGWAGISCTCPAPVNNARGLAPQESPAQLSVDMLQRYAVLFVLVTYQQTFLPTSCTPVGVGVTDSLNNEPTPCLPAANGRWNCPAPFPGYDGFGRFVVVDTAEQAPSCAIAVYSADTPPCGPNGNPYSGAFFRVAPKRNTVLNAQVQTIEFAPFGCTQTACMCNANYVRQSKGAH